MYFMACCISTWFFCEHPPTLNLSDSPKKIRWCRQVDEERVPRCCKASTRFSTRAGTGELTRVGYCFVMSCLLLAEGVPDRGGDGCVLGCVAALSNRPFWINAFTTGNPFWGQNYLKLV